MEIWLKLVISIGILFTVPTLKRFIQWFLLFQYWRRMVKDFPGPKSQYLLGCLREFRGGLKALPDFLLTQSAKVIDQGENVMRIWLGPILRIYVLDSDAVKVLTNSSVELEKGWDYDRLHDWIGEGLITSADERWKLSRKLLTPAFHFAKLDEYAHVMDHHSRELIQVLKPMATNNEQNIYELIKSTSLDIIAETAMGVELTALKGSYQSYTKAISVYLYQSFWRGVSPLYANNFVWWLSGNRHKSKSALKVLKAMSLGVIEKRVQILANQLGEVKKKPDFLDFLLEAHKKGEMTFEQVREEVDTFLFAGYDSTSHAIIWTLWCLATHVEWQERVYNELIEHFGHSDSEFTTNKIKDLKLLDAVIKESMRILPPAPLIERRLRNEIQIGKYTLPKRATVVIPIWAIHHNPKVFPNHWQFEPENFMNDNVLPINAYIPFSAGVRNCLGQKFTMREIRIVLAHLLYNFKFTTQYEFRDNKPSIELVLVPSLGLPVQFEPRH